MNELDLQLKIKEFVLMFLKSINSEITSKNEIYHATIPEPYSTLLDFKSLDFTFDVNKSDSNSCEFVTPGNKFLFKFLNFNIKNGPVALGQIANKNNTTNQIKNKLGVRFYFYILFDGIKHDSQISKIDVDLDTSKLMNIHDCIIMPIDEKKSLDYEKDDVDYSYLAAIDYLRKTLKQKMGNLTSTILILKNEEIKNINHVFQQRIDELEKSDSFTKNKFEEIKEKTRNSNYDRYVNFEEKMNISRDELIDKIQALRLEEKRALETIEKKYKTSIDYALIGAQIFYYGENDNRIIIIS